MIGEGNEVATEEGVRPGSKTSKESGIGAKIGARGKEGNEVEAVGTGIKKGTTKG
jgi:hypothetical protein